MSEYYTCPSCHRNNATQRCVSCLYGELIFAVGKKYPNETRHETALRYIRQAEQSDTTYQAGATRANI